MCICMLFLSITASAIGNAETSLTDINSSAIDKISVCQILNNAS